MKWIVLLILSSNICFGQQIIVEKKLIDFCNEKADEVDTLKKIVILKDTTIFKYKKIVKVDSILFIKHKADSTMIQTQSNNKDRIIKNKNTKTKLLKKLVTKLEVGLGIVIVTSILLLSL